MARTKKIKFDTDSIFIEGRNTKEEKASFITSPLFPIFASAYNASDNRIRVGNYKYNVNGWHEVTIVSSVGFHIGALEGVDTSRESSYRFKSAHTPMVPATSIGQTVIQSCNPRYLASKLSAKSTHPAVTTLRNDNDSAQRLIDTMVYSVIDAMIDKEYGSRGTRSPRVILNSTIATFISKVALGKASMADMPINMRREFDEVYANYTAQTDKFEKTIATTKDFIGGSGCGKWLLFNLPDGVILCAIGSEAPESALDHYLTEGELPGFRGDKFSRYAQYALAPKWYPNYDAIPDEYRSELDYALTVLKVHRNSNDLFPKNDSYGADIKLWPSVGAAMYGHHSGATALMLQR